MKSKFVLPALCAILAMTGCATCDRHPALCGVAIAVVAGSVAACMVSHHKTNAFVAPGATPQPAPGGNLL